MRVARRGAGVPLDGLAGRGGLLLGDGMADAVYEGEEKGEVDGAGDARPVRDVERDQLRDGALHRPAGQGEFGEYGHRGELQGIEMRSLCASSTHLCVKGVPGGVGSLSGAVPSWEQLVTRDQPMKSEVC